MNQSAAISIIKANKKQTRRLLPARTKKYLVPALWILQQNCSTSTGSTGLKTPSMYCLPVTPRMSKESKSKCYEKR